MVWLGIIVIVLTVVAIIKKIDARIALVVAGAIMCVAGGIWKDMFSAFTAQLISSSLVPLITICMGFSAVMEFTGCTQDLVHLMMKPMKFLRMFLVPAAVLITFFINISLQSAAACGAAVGALLIPTMLRFGVNPAIAASAVALGTWGNNLSPGFMFVAQVSEISGDAPETVVGSYLAVSIVAVIAAAVTLTLIDIILYKRKGNKKDADMSALDEITAYKVNIIKAILPLFPIIMILIGSRIGLSLDVTAWMLIGTVLGLLTNYKGVKETTNIFFKGMGNAFADIIGLMAAAGVFTAGMAAVGVTDALLEIMRGAQSVAQLGATFGPLSLATVTGSGNAATIAFNEAFTPFAADFGFGINQLGGVAMMTGGIGRAMSPVAGVVIILARMAKVEPMEVTKHNLVPCLVAALVLMFGLL